MVAEPLLVVIAGPTASGKTALALRLAEDFAGEIVSCDSVAVYRGMEIGSAKPTLDERGRVPHHLIDVAFPDQAFTAGDYSRLAREAVRGIAGRGRLPIVAGGTGLYLRAFLDGLFAAPPRNEPLRRRLRDRAALRGSAHLHRVLGRLDAEAARQIHPNDAPKLIRAIEVTLTSHRHDGSGFIPISEQWRQSGRDPLTGFRVLQLCLNPHRAELYERINRRGEEMFELGLVEETEVLVERYGYECRALTSLGYAQAVAFLRGEMSRDEAVAAAQQGHRNYAKRQLTWFRKNSGMHWLCGLGSERDIQTKALELLRLHLH